MGMGFVKKGIGEFGCQTEGTRVSRDLEPEEGGQFDGGVVGEPWNDGV